MQNVKINDSEHYVKILGIYFTKDLQTTGIYNWNKYLTQIEKQTHQFSRRHLPLRGKAILLNSVILSKVTFLSKVFPIPKTLRQKIENIIFYDGPEVSLCTSLRHFPPSVFLLPCSIFKFPFEIWLKQIRDVIAKLGNCFDVSKRNVFKERFIIFCFSKSCLHGLSVVFYVLAIIVALYYIIARYSSLYGSHAENISTEETAEGCSSSPMFFFTNLLLNDENIGRDKFIIY